MANFFDNIFFIFERLNWLSVLDIALVTLIFFALLYTLRDTQAMVLLRGAIFLIIALILLTSLVELPAFSWLPRRASAPSDFENSCSALFAMSRTAESRQADHRQD